MKTIIYPGQDDARIGEWVRTRIAGAPETWGKFKAIGLEKDGELIAGIVYTNYMPAHSFSMSIAAVGKYWMTREFLYQAFHYPFNVCKCVRLNTFVRASAKSVRAFDKNIGWVEEGIARLGFSASEDAILLGMLREDCRFLELGVSHV